MSTAPEGLDLAALQTWFTAHVAGAGDAPLRASLIAGGRSNLTYHVTDGAHDWVVRRPPLGHVVAFTEYVRALAPAIVFHFVEDAECCCHR